MPPALLGKDEAISDKPTCFGRYNVVRELGTGGMAQVFEARHTELDRRVALKVMQPALAAQPSAAARFLREAQAACHIRHQHVVEVFDIGIDHGLPYIVMEYLEGSNLAALLAEKGPLPLPGIANIFLPVISAVSTAHAAGVIHRDLKPANLMLANRRPRSPHPVVLDFGISKIANEELENTLTRSESLLGTVQYMAPELTKGAKFASIASDQYALGVMLYECATGQRPFTGQSHYELMHAIVTAPVVPPSQLRPRLPPEFDALVEKAMHRDPAKRFPSVQALGGALLSFGDRAAWTLWEGEFVGTSRDVDLWGTDSGTLQDAPGGGRATASSQPLVRTDAVGGRSARAVLAPLAIYAGVVTALLARRSLETSSTERTAEPRASLPVGGEPLLDHRPSSASERSGASAPQSPEGSARVEPPLAAAGPASVQHLVKSAPIAKRVPLASRSLPTPPQSSPAPAVPDLEQSPAPKVHEGTNGAPIVD